MNVQCFILTSGETIIADSLLFETDFVGSTRPITLMNPAQLFMQQISEGRMGLSMIPYATFAEKHEIKLNQHAIAAQFTPNVELTNEYSRLFGTGIQLATMGDLSAAVSIN